MLICGPEWSWKLYIILQVTFHLCIGIAFLIKWMVENFT
jgi:hypothetical protein